MARGQAARRYAKALFQLAKEEGQVEALRAEVGAFQGLLEESEELRDVLLQPLHPVSQRRAVLAAVAERQGASPMLKSFLGLLVDNRRLVDFEAIRDEIERLAAADAGLRKAFVRTASPLGETQRERLRAALSRRVGGDLQLEVEQDPSLLGGVVAQVGDLVFDGSLRSQLERLRASLKTV
jgi:F-type H+-transporting ATPase subunit delta